MTNFFGISLLLLDHCFDFIDELTLRSGRSSHCLCYRGLFLHIDLLMKLKFIQVVNRIIICRVVILAKFFGVWLFFGLQILLFFILIFFVLQVFETDKRILIRIVELFLVK